MSRGREGLVSLLARSWLKRIWILQEVANARAAEVVCGTISLSARVFALTPSLLGITPDSHCQAVLDIMPGPSRRSSCWAEEHNLLTLLVKFSESEASDPRDKIYALLGMSSDACDTDLLSPNYNKSDQEVVRNTISFLLKVHKSGYDIQILPDWTLPKFLGNIGSFNSALLEWALEKDKRIAELVVNCDGFDIDWTDDFGRTLLSREAALGREQIVELLLEMGADINVGDGFRRTAFIEASARGHGQVVKLLLDRGADINSEDGFGRSALNEASAGGHEQVVKLLLDRGADIDGGEGFRRSALSEASARGHEQVVELLLDKGAEIDGGDGSCRSALSEAEPKAVSRL